MIFYRVLGTSSAPSCLVATQADAKALAKERGTSWEQENVPDPKAERMDYVNGLLADIHTEMHREPTSTPITPHSERGEAGDPDEQSAEPVGGQLNEKFSNGTPPAAVHKAVRFEDEFDAMPLATQLHYAARAMENARDQL